MMPVVVKKEWFPFCIVLCFGTGFLYSLSVTDMTPLSEMRPDVSRYFETNQSVDRLMARNKPLQTRRVKRIRAVCEKSSVFATQTFDEQIEPIYYYTPNYDFTFCKVPKSGSTFWTQTFEILNFGNASADEVFSRKRVSVHGDSRRFQTLFNSSERQHAPAVLVSRDPFSRLYSAFIDKIFIPLMFDTYYDIHQDISGKQQNICPRHVTFQQFLDYVVREAYNGTTLDRHWAPISSLCRPCESSIAILVKQETFASDVEYAFKVFDVDHDKAKILLDKLYGQRLESTVPGIVETVYHHVNRTDALKCFGYHDIADKVWISFQIQGYLKNTIPFPKNINLKDLINATSFSDIIMNSIALHTMSREEQKAQRKEALVNAYQKVKKETIKHLQHVYRTDFDMFGYRKELSLS